MSKALTVLGIEKAQPGATRREIPDGLLPSLYLVVQPTGAKSWAVRYRIGGKPRKLTLGTYPGIDLACARDLARKALVAVAEGIDPGERKRASKRSTDALDRDLFENVAESFIERHAKPNTRPSTSRETERIIRRDVVPIWRGRPVQHITKRDVIDLLDRIVDRGSGIMANRTLAHVRRLFSWCVERDILKTSPAAGVRPPAEEGSRDRVLSDEEVRLVWHAAEAIGWPFGPMVKLLLLTGQRRDEVASMTWSEIDPDRRLWTLARERAKNNQAHEVPLSDAAIAVLCSLPRVAKSDHVFTTNGTTAVSGFSRAKDRIDAILAEQQGPDGSPTPRWVLHDLRRTAASGMARLGINLPVIEKVLNHSSGSFAGIVGVYQRHSFADEKRLALEAWGRFVAGLVKDQPINDLIELQAVL